MNKETLRQLIAQDKLDIATEQLIQFTSQLGNSTWEQKAASIADEYKTYQKNSYSKKMTNDELLIVRNKIVTNYMELINELPNTDTNTKTSTPPKTKGFREDYLKTGIFFTLFLGKIILFLWIIFQLQTGGLSPSEAMATAGFLLPIFVAYLSAIVSEAVRNRYYKANGNGHLNGKKRVRSSLVWITFTILPIYFITFWIIIGQRAQGNLSPESMNNMLALTESALGAYVGIIVFDLFRPRE